MYTFVKQTVSEAVEIFSVYFLILYSLGVTVLYIVSATENPNLTPLLLLLSSTLILLARKGFQTKFRQIYSKYAIGHASGLLLRLVLSFSLTLQLFFLFSHEFRRKLPVIDVIESNISTLLAQYVLAALAGAILLTVILFLAGKRSGWEEWSKKRGLGITTSVFGMLIIQSIGSLFPGTHGGWYGIPESLLTNIGYFCLGSIPLLQFRLLFFGSDLKRE